MSKSVGALSLPIALAVALGLTACGQEAFEGRADDLGAGDTGGSSVGDVPGSEGLDAYTLLPDGAIVGADGAIVDGDAVVVLEDGAIVDRDAVTVLPDGAIVARDALTTLPDGAVVDRDGAIVDPDVGPDVTGGDSAGGADTEAPFCRETGCGCATAADCDSELCVPTPDGLRCTERCVDSCTQAGYDCRVADQNAVDPVSACFPSYLHLCEPCRDDASCQYRGGERCIPAPNPDDGSFCTTPCDAAGACPGGFRCAQLPFAGGLEAHCVPETGTCECRPAWADDGLETDCETTNAFGTCPGTRTCGPNGLTACTGAPAAEVCNGVDDDCDGVTDNIAPGTPCEVSNAFGTCPGTLACEGGRPVCRGPSAAAEVCDLVDNDCNGQTDEGTCDDGLACTVDTCVGVGRCAHELAAGSCLIDGACVAAGAANPSGACERCVPGTSSSSWTPTSDGFPASQCYVDPCAGAGPIDPATCCSVGLACADDDHLVTTFACTAPAGAQNRVVEFYGDLCCYDASERRLTCTSYGEWSAGSGRDTDPAHNPALVAVTAARTTSGGEIHHDTDWQLNPAFFNEAGNFCQFVAEGWAVDDPAQTGDKRSYPGAGYPVAQWNYDVDPRGGGDVTCGGGTGTGPHTTCDPPLPGAAMHTVTLSLNADDGWEGWLNGQSLGPLQDGWQVVETSTHQLAEGCHVLAVHAKDLHQVVSGFQGRVKIDGVDKYLTGTHRELWRMTAAPPAAQFGVTWLERAYDDSSALWFEPLVCTSTNWYGTAAPKAMRDAGAPMVWWGTPSCTGLGESWVRLEIHVP